MCHAQTLIISSTEGMPVFHIRFHCQVKTKLSSSSKTVNCILNMMVPRCLLSSEIRLTLNRLQAPGGRKFVMIIKLRGWCRGRRTFRAPSNTSCLTPAPESRSETPNTKAQSQFYFIPLPLVPSNRVSRGRGENIPLQWYTTNILLRHRLAPTIHTLYYWCALEPLITVLY